MPRFAPRIHVLLARDAPVGLVIRRGPSKCVATLLWDRRRDTFQWGQWLKGRIYERRCDLSPDGKFLLYFAMNGKWNTESRGSWTAISRAPYLRAMAFFPKGNCWNGGGLWTGDNTYWLNDCDGHTLSQDTAAVRRDRRFQPSENYGGECPGVYYHRLLRDGWKLVERLPDCQWNAQDIFEKAIGAGWTLRKIAHSELNAPAGKGCYWDEHALLAPDGTQIPCPDWEWADLDRKRLVWSVGGKLFAAKIQQRGLSHQVQLQDFKDMAFEAIQAPY